MKSARACESIEEIRECIDSIDKGIVDYLAQRVAYVECASKFKKTIADIKAADRVKAMLETRRAWAMDAGISLDFIEALFRGIVAYFVNGETVQWKKENASHDAPII